LDKEGFSLPDFSKWKYLGRNRIYWNQLTDEIVNDDGRSGEDAWWGYVNLYKNPDDRLRGYELDILGKGPVIRGWEIENDGEDQDAVLIDNEWRLVDAKNGEHWALHIHDHELTVLWVAIVIFNAKDDPVASVKVTK
jgi:hypothetical protein